MAGKQRNVKIVYQLDTSQVKAATQVVTQAKTATDQLKQSTKQLSDQSKQTSQQYKANIQDIIGEMTLLKQKIMETATTDKARLNELIPKYQQLKEQVNQFNRSLEGTAKSSASVGVSLGGVYNAVRTVLVAGLIRETANAVIQMTALAGKIEGVKRAFDKLPNSVLLMEELKQRTHGALTELELMQKALQAKNFGIPIEQLGKLLEFAAIKSQQTGISIQYLTDSIVTGLGRESIKILDNLQIDIGKLKARMQETGKTMREVVGDIVNEELKKMGGYLETGETKVNRLTTAWKQLGAEVSKTGASGSLIDFLTKGLEGWRALFAAQGGDVKGFLQTEAARAEAAANVSKIRDDATKNLTNEIGLTIEELNLRKQVLQELKDEKQVRDEGRNILQKFGDFVGRKILDEKVFLEDKIAIMEYETEVYTIQLDLLEKLQKSNEIKDELDKENVVTIETLEKKIEDLTDQKKKLNVEDRAGIKAINFQIEAVQRLIDKLNDLGMDRKSSASEIRKAFEDNPILAELAGKVDKGVDASLDKSLELIKKRIQGKLKLYSDAEKEREKQREKELKDEGRQQRILTDMAIQSAHMILSAWNAAASQREDTTVESLDKQMKAFDEYAERTLKTAGSNERRRLELEIKIDEERKRLEAQRETAQIAADERAAAREKKERLRQIAIDTAAGIVRALTISPGIGRGGGIAAGIIAGTSIIQAAIVNKYKDGVIDLKGEGTETSDSIPAMLSKRESVMTAAETKSSMNILKSIRARKLNDKIFEKLVVNSPAAQPTDLSPLVRELRNNRPPDIARQGYSIYETREVQKGVRQRTRKAIFAS